MRPIISYLRVSTDKQGRSGLGLEAQREANARFAAAHGFEIDDELVEWIVRVLRVVTKRMLGPAVIDAPCVHDDPRSWKSAEFPRGDVRPHGSEFGVGGTQEDRDVRDTWRDQRQVEQLCVGRHRKNVASDHHAMRTLQRARR